VAEGIAEPRRLDLDDVGAEVREHRGAARSEHEGGQLDDPDAVEQGLLLRHGGCSPLVLWLLVRVSAR
jgi:hypothetical protein